MNKEDRREYNKLAKRKQCQCFDQSLASSSSIKRDFQITPSSGKKNSLCQDLLTKYLHKNINQQWTKEIWEDTSQWESNDTKHHQKVEIMKKSTQKRKSSTRIQVSSTRSSAAKVWQQMTLQMKVTRMVQRVSQHLWRTMKILSLEISKTRRLIWHMYVVLHESNWYLYVIGTAIRSTYCCTWS